MNIPGPKYRTDQLVCLKSEVERGDYRPLKISGLEPDRKHSGYLVKRTEEISGIFLVSEAEIIPAELAREKIISFLTGRTEGRQELTEIIQEILKQQKILTQAAGGRNRADQMRIAKLQKIQG